VVAIAIWARGLGLARNGRAAAAQAEIDKLQAIEEELKRSGSAYWALQAEILAGEIRAWCAQAENKPQEAAELMRAAAEQEDGVEKLPVTPGPILPAREQLGELLMAQGFPGPAAKEFDIALKNAPGRLGAVRGAAQAAELARDKTPATQ
jgi:hypothetical protein